VFAHVKIPRLTAAVVETGLVVLTLKMGTLGAPGWVFPLACGMAGGWWFVTRGSQLVCMARSAPMKLAGSVLLAVVLIGAVHGIAWAFGRMMHEGFTL
jgi:hypothetical protein